MILPSALEPGDRIALVAPAGPVDEQKIRTAIDRCRRLDLIPVAGVAVTARHGYLAGTDGERASDLRWALSDDHAGIWAIRGGYGTLRALEHVDLEPLRRNPRPFIGFSDNTAIHLALLRRGVLSFHGPHAGFAHFPPETEASFRAALFGRVAPGPLPMPGDAAPVTLVRGHARGPLVGGNLAMLAATCGTRYQPDTRGAILFIEDVGEPLYRIDRMLVQLRLAGLLDGVAGIAVGQFIEMVDPVLAADAGPEPSLESLLAEALAPLGVPAVMGLPFGHGPQNWTLPVGAAATLDADTGSIEITEAVTAPRKRAT